MSNNSIKRLIFFLLIFSFVSILPFTSPSLPTVFCPATNYEAVLLYEHFSAVQFDDPFQTDYVLNWSYTLSASYRHMVLLFTRENFDKVNYILTLNFRDETAEYYVLSDSSSLHDEGSFQIPAVGIYVFVIFNNDSLCDILHAVLVNYSVDVYDTIADLPIGLIITLSLFGSGAIVFAILMRWLKVKAERPEYDDETASKASSQPKEPKAKMKYKHSSSFRCASCGKKIQALVDNCPYCHEPISCSICKLTINSTDTLSKCPYCGCIGHSEHFLKWLQINTKCPKCQVKLETNGLIFLLLTKSPDE